MIRQTPDFSAFPKMVRVGTGKSAVDFKLRPTHFAVQHPEGQPGGTEDDLSEEHIGIYPIEAYQRQIHGPQPVPVYSPKDSPSFAVPTGMIFVRLSPGLKIEDRAKKFEDAGYELAKIVSYAPNAGWLRAKSGKVADALANAPRLNAVAGVENVEPQMLSKAVRRS
jgi:hypothetical protein